MTWDFTFPAETSVLALRHARLFTALRGPGPVVLFVHGGFHGAWCWAPYMRLFAERNVPTASIDLRGHGGLTQDSGFIHDGVGATSEDVAEAAAALGGDVVLVGHSLGALVAMAAAHEVTPLGLAMLAPAPPGNIPKLHALPAFSEATIVAPPPDARARRWLLQGLAADADLAPYLARLCGESPALLNDRYLERITVDPAWVAGPRLCMSGGRDASPLVDAREGPAVAALFGADCATITDAGHCFMVEPTWRESGGKLLAWLAAHRLIGSG